MKARKRILWIVAALLFSVLLAIFMYRCISLGDRYRQELEYSYARSLGDFTEYLSDMENTLDKAKYVSTSTGQASVSAKLREASGGAKAAMAALPFAEDQSAQIEKSISVLGDFALYVGAKSAKGEALSPEDYESFQVLAQHVQAISRAFADIRQKAADGKISVGETQKLLAGALNLPGIPGLDDGLSDLSKELSALPTMLYDGPFSDHIEKREPEYIKDMEEISGEEAVEKAALFLKTEPGGLSVVMEAEGPLAAYEIRGDKETIKITKKGGQVSFYKKDMEVSGAVLSYEDALQKAKTLLEESGFSNMRESYYVVNDNTCTINFAAVQEDVILYSDLIKVTVELGEGGLVEFSSTGYLMNHRKRENLVPEIDESTAEQSVSERLSVKNIAVALTPTAGQGEVLCYEFTCEKEDGGEIIVYIDSKTALEEQIYVVTQSDQGKRVS